MFPRKTRRELFDPAESFGWNPANTFRCVSSVCATFRSYSYLPNQRKVFPSGMTSRSLVSTLCCLNTSSSSFPKSPPTTATTRTSVKKLAEIEKCEAEPPNIFSRLPNGVSTASKATEPTTSRDIEFGIWNLESGIPIKNQNGRTWLCYSLLLTVNRLRFTYFRFRAAERLQIVLSFCAKHALRMIVDQLG